MNIVADIHCHTLASTHAYSTVVENVDVAARKRLFAVGITDHGPKMPGAPGKWFFKNLVNIPRKLKGVYIIRGVEANILNDSGDIDLDLEYEHAHLDIIIASIHGPTFEAKSDKEYRTRAYMNLAKNPKVNIIGHSGTADFTYNFEKVIPEFKKKSKIVEINNHSFAERKGSAENCLKIAKVCKDCGARVVLSSDAHFCENIGEVTNAAKMLKDINFPEELIINSNVEIFKQYLKETTNVLED